MAQFLPPTDKRRERTWAHKAIGAPRKVATPVGPSVRDPGGINTGLGGEVSPAEIQSVPLVVEHKHLFNLLKSVAEDEPLAGRHPQHNDQTSYGGVKPLALSASR